MTKPRLSKEREASIRDAAALTDPEQKDAGDWQVADLLAELDAVRAECDLLLAAVRQAIDDNKEMFKDSRREISRGA